MLKHKKNLDIIALSTVCKSWHQYITSSKILFRDIAFDISCEESIATAGVFLKALEGTQIPVNVYAHLGENTSDPMIMKLLTRLRPHIEHMVRFNYRGNMNAYRSYFDIPAPNLLYFSDCFDTYPGRGPPLFCGQTPRLRALTTVSQNDKIVWTASALSDLTVLDLAPSRLGLVLPLRSLLELLQGSPRLEILKFPCFGLSIGCDEHLQDVLLSHLHTLNLDHSEFHTIVKYLRMPSVRKISFLGYSYAPGDAGAISPTFEAPHLFAGLPLFPVFGHPVKGVYVETTLEGEDKVFKLRLTADGGFVLDVQMGWILDTVILFDDYVTRSIVELMKIMTLGPRAHVELHHTHMVPSDTPIYQQFLQVDNIDRLTIRGRIAMDVLSDLTVRPTSPRLLPRLRLLEIVDQLSLSGEGRMILLSCLQSRTIGDIPFSIRLMDAYLARADFSKFGYIVERG